ncbi:hypothetical protein BpHYR1_020841, partial [Brachionus plicatilis]
MISPKLAESIVKKKIEKKTKIDILAKNVRDLPPDPYFFIQILKLEKILNKILGPLFLFIEFKAKKKLNKMKLEIFKCSAVFALDFPEKYKKDKNGKILPINNYWIFLLLRNQDLNNLIAFVCRRYIIIRSHLNNLVALHLPIKRSL